eukprot:1111369-Prorocentrum_minimum.AAC.4
MSEVLQVRQLGTLSVRAFGGWSPPPPPPIGVSFPAFPFLPSLSSETSWVGLARPNCKRDCSVCRDTRLHTPKGSRTPIVEFAIIA